MTTLLHRRPLRRVHAESALVVAAGIAYLAVTGWAMANLTYDVWGALIAIPVAAAVLVPLAHLAFRHRPELLRIAYVGVATKCAGAIARYWVAFDAYGGAADAQAYHDAGRIYGEQIRDGAVGPWSIIPHGQGTEFIRHLTGTVYALTGSSKLGGFIWFSVFGFVGVMLCIKAAELLPTTIDVTRYAWLCVLSPSLVFWPSSVGKESWMLLSFGVINYGAARLLTGQRLTRPLLALATGTLLALLVRPHMAAIWVGAGVVGLGWATIVGRSGRRQGAGRGGTLLALAVGVVGLVVVGRLALEFLPGAGGNESVTQQIGSALDVNLRRTSGGGSEFTPPSVATPLDYPLAVLRTLTRPLPFEVRGLSTLLPSVETTALIALAIVGLRRLAAIPRALRRSAFVVFHFLVVVLTALAFASFSNLAILVRQRSLLMPSLLVLLSLYPAPSRRPATSP